MIVFLTVLATLVVVVLILNLGVAQERVEYEIDAFYPVEDPQFIHVMGTLLGPPVVPGNSYAVLRNGDAIFPAMLAAIRAAEKTIAFETYIYWSGDIGHVFADALAAKARAGVKVHLLLDWVGSGKLDARSLQDMQDAGVQVERFHKPKLLGLARLNNRTHRKLLVVDGRIAFTGGVGVADQWTGDAQDPEHWRDTHFRVEGPVVAQVQAAFMDNWMKATGRVFHGEAYFPRMDAREEPGGAEAGSSASDGIAQMFSGSPAEGSGSMELMYLLSIQSATRSIRLSSSYFVPDRTAIREFVEATKRGVRVQIIVPGAHIDTKLVRFASKHMWGPLLAAGVEIHEYLPTMFHVKVMVVDEYLVSVGSTNFDDRSFHLNDESNLNIYDRAFANEQVAIFDQDLERTRRVTLAEWKRRSWREKAMERFAHLLQSQL